MALTEGLNIDENTECLSLGRQITHNSEEEKGNEQDKNCEKTEPRTKQQLNPAKKTQLKQQDQDAMNSMDIEAKQ